MDSRNASSSCQGPGHDRPKCPNRTFRTVFFVPARPVMLNAVIRQHFSVTSESVSSKLHIAVVGAGAFGGWTALHLLERGAHVTLLDAWGSGNSRASSGGETRIMRGTYGPDQPYSKLAARALKLWQKHERRWKKQFLHRTGVLWMVSSSDDAYERGSLDVLRQAKVKFQELST